MDELLIATSARELRAAIQGALEHDYNLQRRLDQAHRVAAPFEGVGAVANAPGLMDARRELEALPLQIEASKRRISDLIKRLSERMIEEDRASREGREFWFRRFMLSLQIGNGAAFLATVAGLLQADKDVLSVMAVLAWPPAMYFGLGVGSAGLLPLLMFAREAVPVDGKWRRIVHLAVLTFTTFSMGFFALGAGSVVVEIRQLGVAAVEAARKAEAHKAVTSVPARPLSPAKITPSIQALPAS